MNERERELKKATKLLGKAEQDYIVLLDKLTRLYGPLLIRGQLDARVIMTSYKIDRAKALIKAIKNDELQQCKHGMSLTRTCAKCYQDKFNQVNGMKRTSK